MWLIVTGQKPWEFGWRRQWGFFEFLENLLSEHSCMFEPHDYLSIFNFSSFLNIWKKKSPKYFSCHPVTHFYSLFIEIKYCIIFMINSFFSFFRHMSSLAYRFLCVLGLCNLHSSSVTFSHFYLCHVLMNFGTISKSHSIFHDWGGPLLFC